MCNYKDEQPVSGLYCRRLAISFLALTIAGFCMAGAQEKTTEPVASSTVGVQQAPSTNPAIVAQSNSAQLGAAQADSDHYRIGPGDVLDIRVFNKPQFSRDAIRVDMSGLIRMPLIEGEIKALCKTESELAKEISDRYLDYIRQPQVDVFVKDYQSQQVAVVGAVHQPSRFQLHRPVRLLDVLTQAGGVSEKAGRTIQVVHSPEGFDCGRQNSPLVADAVANELDFYNLSETIRGDEKANPFLRPGDVVTIPDAEEVYVVGNVLRPSILLLNEPLTISRAIAMAGGVMPDTKSDKIRIVRQEIGSPNKTEVMVSLVAIEHHQVEDVQLKPNDIVDVPASGSKRFLRSLVGGVAPMVSQLPIRVIP